MRVFWRRGPADARRHPCLLPLTQDVADAADRLNEA